MYDNYCTNISVEMLRSLLLKSLFQLGEMNFYWPSNEILLNTELTASNLKIHVIEAQIVTANTCRQFKGLKNSACPATLICLG